MNSQELKKEAQFKAVRSSGKGGQHVNKVSSKVELLFHIAASKLFTAVEKQLLKQRLGNRISNEGFLRVTCQDGRSQNLNRKKALMKLETILSKALKINKERIPTKPTKGMNEHRLKEKRLLSEKKASRTWMLSKKNFYE